MSNRLEHEDSPYLQQHKQNPVDWYPWCEEAFAKAEAQNKAIFISIGYSSCHWCHAMEEKVFENQECADILNEHFISIIVDREERPDIDKHFQEVHQLLNNRSGGWPTSVFCTPQNKPFFAGTYIAPESEEGSIEGMGFVELTKLISSKISQNDEDIYKNADEVEEFLSKETHPTQATVLKEEFTKNFMLQAKNNYDTKYGGFLAAPKFPHVSTLGTLLTIDKLYDDKAARAMLHVTLDSMKKGGFYDLKDGGFYRFSIDEKFQEPHLEKTLYDNALLCELYTDTYLTCKDKSYLQTAKNVADYWYKSMSKDELFYSSLDLNNINQRIQTSWSSMMIKALFTLGNIDEKYKTRAIKSLDALLDTMFIDGTLYHSTLIHKTPKIEAFLEDYAYLSQALITAYNATQDEVYLIYAQRFANKALERFYKNGTWKFSDEEFATKADIADNTYISSVSIMIDVLISITTLLKDDKYAHFAFKTLEYNSYELGRRPVLYPYMLKQMLRYLKDDIINKNFKGTK